MKIRNSQNIKAFFRPDSIAIIGASENFSKVSGRPLMLLMKHGYRGKIYPVNPKSQMIAGIPCYRSVRDLPFGVNLAAIVVPARLVLESLEACAERGVKSAVIISSGFAELGNNGRQEQEKIEDLARNSGMKVMGPNSVGFANISSKAIATISQAFEADALVSGSIGLISQSGAFGTAIFAMAQRRKIGISYFISSGNEADMGFADYTDYMLEDPNTRVIAGYIEELRNPELFVAVAEKAMKREKPIVLMKVGSSAAGRRAASSHTGSMVGSDDIYNAVLKQKGVVRAQNVEELLDFSNTFVLSKMPEGKNVGIITMSGGAAILMADKCEEIGLEVPELSGKTVEQIKAVLPGFGVANNPVDVTAQFANIPNAFNRIIQTLSADDRIDIVAIFLNLIWSSWEEIARQIINGAKAIHKPLMVVWVEGKPEALEMLRKNDIPVYTEPTRCIKSIGALVQYGRKRQQVRS